MNITNRAKILNEPKGFRHNKKHLLEAVRAHMVWELAESENLGPQLVITFGTGGGK